MGAPLLRIGLTTVATVAAAEHCDGPGSLQATTTCHGVNVHQLMLRMGDEDANEVMERQLARPPHKESMVFMP